MCCDSGELQDSAVRSKMHINPNTHPPSVDHMPELVLSTKSIQIPDHKKANRMTGMIIENIQYKSKNIVITLFRSLVRPVLEYGNVVWNTCLVKHNDSN